MTTILSLMGHANAQKSQNALHGRCLRPLCLFVAGVPQDRSQSERRLHPAGETPAVRRERASIIARREVQLNISLAQTRAGGKSKGGPSTTKGTKNTKATKKN
jgi:hypothetical protein